MNDEDGVTIVSNSPKTKTSFATLISVSSHDKTQQTTSRKGLTFDHTLLKDVLILNKNLFERFLYPEQMNSEFIFKYSINIQELYSIVMKKIFFYYENLRLDIHVLHLVIEWKYPRGLNTEEYGTNMK